MFAAPAEPARAFALPSVLPVTEKSGKSRRSRWSAACYGFAAHIAERPLAFPATHAISSSSPAAHHAHGAKAHGKSGGANSFADLLAAADASPDDEATADVTAKAAAEAPDAQAGAAQDDGEDAAIVPAQTPETLAALPQTPDKPQAAALPDKKDDKDPQAKPGEAVNDDGAALVPPPLTAIPQPAAAPAAAAPAAAAPKTDATPPHAGATIPQIAATQPDAAAGQAANAAGAQQAAADAAGADAAGTKAKPAADFKKALDDAKAAPAKTAPAKADNAPAPTPDPHAGQTDTRAADAAAQPPAPAPANASPQTGILPVALPPAHSAAAQALVAAPQPALPPTLATPQHTPNMESLAVDIAAKSLGGAKQFDIRLDPPELGRVEVRLSIDATGKASAHLTADQPQTLDLLQKDASTLTRALRDAGLNVNQNGLNFSLRNQQQQAGNDRQHRPSGGRAVRGSFAAPASLQPIAAAAASSGRSGRSLLDIKV
jgi:flagellar hook-length control protein FliK